MKLLVGLGNPGAEYAKNRHNIGFMVLDYLAETKHASFSKKKESAIAQIGRNYALKPLTYMNRSGLAVREFLKYHSVEEMMVISDDVNLPLGEIRLRQNGSDGGHNGLKSIQSDNPEFPFFRMRIGVGNSSQKKLADFVLGDFSSSERKILESTFQFANEMLNIYLEDNFDGILKYYSKNKKSYSEKITQNQQTIGGIDG